MVTGVKAPHACLSGFFSKLDQTMLRTAILVQYIMESVTEKEFVHVEMSLGWKRSDVRQFSSCRLKWHLHRYG